MAKPGSAEARAISAGGAVDLRAAGMTDEQAQGVQEDLELSLGTRCNGCGRRITIGFRFTSLDPRDAERPVARYVACTRADCDFALKAKKGSTYVEPVEFSWVDENGPDAPAAGVIVERNERMAEQAAAAEAAGDSSAIVR